MLWRCLKRRKSFSKYLFVKQYLREVHIPLKENILNLILSFILSLLIFSGAIAVIINLFVFVDYQKLLAAGLGLVLSLVLTISKVLYYTIVLKDNKVEGIITYYLYDGLISAIMMVLIFILLY